MEAKHYATCLWPGLAELWWRGRLTALPAAIGFAIAFNLVLIARYIYPEWMASGLVSMAFWIGLIAWFFYVIHSIRELPGLITPRQISQQPDRFPEARDAFLCGRWVDAEGLLTDVLAIEPRDPPALLLLTGVYRHTGRLDAAEILLQEISKLEIADPWWLELTAEQNRLARAKEAQNEEQAEKGPQHEEKNVNKYADLSDDALKAA